MGPALEPASTLTVSTVKNLASATVSTKEQKQKQSNPSLKIGEGRENFIPFFGEHLGPLTTVKNDGRLWPVSYIKCGWRKHINKK